MSVRGRRDWRRNEKERKKDGKKNCELGVFGRASDFNIIIGGLDFNM